MGRDCGPGVGGLRPVPPLNKARLLGAVAPAVFSNDLAGSAHGRFERAIRDRQLRRASMAARELGAVSLVDAPLR